MSSAVFIAVQCFQCSTMQVKQRKKSSSNKWNCVVCNEKQSVRKVFSQASMAKDVRKFVQTFNMSRQIQFNQQLHHDDGETLTQQQTQTQPTKRRTDWTEYINADDHDDDDQRGESCGPNVVTEMPKPLFKKPKLMNTYSPAAADNQKLQRPIFAKRNKFNNNNNNPVKEIVKGGRVGGNQHNHDIVDHGISNSMIKRNSKVSACDDADGGFTDIGSSSVMIKLKRPVPKWDSFVDDDDDDESGCEEINAAVAFETKVSDEIVEDDVYPDFI